MESTGKYLIPKDIKWIYDLYIHGMIKPSFIPPVNIYELRDLVRYQYKLTCMITGKKNRSQNCLTLSNAKSTPLILRQY